MHIPSTIRTTFGPRALSHRPMIRVSLTPEELHRLILTVERAATEAERDGDMTAAHHLSWRAGALREVAR